jgi:uncharacterized membrane protein YphA (DoxX/SURF4 family)
MKTTAGVRLFSFFGRFALIWFFLYISTLSFDYFLLQPWFDFVNPPFRWFAEFTGMKIFGVNLVGADGFYADTLIVYVHLFNLALLATVIALAWTLVSKKRFSETAFRPLLFTLLRYFVALNLLIYGLAKVYKWQFMLPEPNILYTRVGDMHRDMLYWTSMGTSRAYSVFMGVIEVVPAILLLFRRTTLIGAFVAAAVMLNVVAVNFSFDITVKLHSTTLLLMCIVILLPGRKRIAALFTGKAAAPFSYPQLSFATNRKWIAPAAKLALIALLLCEAHYPYTQTQNFNDDVAARPAMHGAYEVISSTGTNLHNALLPGNSVASTVKMIFIHRRDYIIFHMQDGSMRDYPMQADTAAHRVNYGSGSEQHSFEWQQVSADRFSFWGYLEQEDASLQVQRVDLRRMKLLEEEFTLIDQD